MSDHIDNIAGTLDEIKQRIKDEEFKHMYEELSHLRKMLASDRRRKIMFLYTSIRIACKKCEDSDEDEDEDEDKKVGAMVLTDILSITMECELLLPRFDVKQKKHWYPIYHLNTVFPEWVCDIIMKVTETSVPVCKCDIRIPDVHNKLISFMVL
jgi:hypothetical protein